MLIQGLSQVKSATVTLCPCLTYDLVLQQQDNQGVLGEMFKDIYIFKYIYISTKRKKKVHFAGVYSRFLKIKC